MKIINLSFAWMTAACPNSFEKWFGLILVIEFSVSTFVSVLEYGIIGVHVCELSNARQRREVLLKAIN